MSGRGRRGAGSSPADKRGSVFGRWAQIFQFRNTPRHIHREIDTEIDFHLDQRVRSLMQEGMSRDAAEREAREKFGAAARRVLAVVAGQPCAAGACQRG